MGSHAAQRSARPEGQLQAAGIPCTQGHHAGWEIWLNEGWAQEGGGVAHGPVPLPCWLALGACTAAEEQPFPPLTPTPAGSQPRPSSHCPVSRAPGAAHRPRDSLISKVCH